MKFGNRTNLTFKLNYETVEEQTNEKTAECELCTSTDKTG